MLMAPFDYQLQTSPDIAIRLAGGGEGRGDQQSQFIVKINQCVKTLNTFQCIACIFLCLKRLFENNIKIDLINIFWKEVF